MNDTIRAELITFRGIIRSLNEDDKELVVGHFSGNNMAILNKIVGPK